MNDSTAPARRQRLIPAASGSQGSNDRLAWWRTSLRRTPPPLNLALQGGGAHGAFTWGVLDALLQDQRIRFEGLSGNSAGAMNAAVLADGATLLAQWAGYFPPSHRPGAVQAAWRGPTLS